MHGWSRPAPRARAGSGEMARRTLRPSCGRAVPNNVRFLDRERWPCAVLLVWLRRCRCRAGRHDSLRGKLCGARSAENAVAARIATWLDQYRAGEGYFVSVDDASERYGAIV